jgi:flagellar hook-associated protein 1 FlgK
MAVTGDILGIGVSALLSNQRALSTTSHNIANVNTEGYSRQRVELSARSPQATPSGFIGTGVQTVTVARLYDNFLNTQVLNATASDGRMGAYAAYSTQVDNLLADPSTGLSPALTAFFNALQEVADNPSDIAPRQVLLAEGESLTARIQTLDAEFESLAYGVNNELRALSGEITSYADAIAKLNRDIVLASGASGGQPPNDLLDERDQLLNELAARVAITVTEQEDGSKNVFIGSGQTLVIGTQAATVTATPSPYDAGELELTLSMGAGSIMLDPAGLGGHIGGVIEFREQVLDPARNELGRVAITLAETLNAQHTKGQDLYDQLGADFFSVPAPEVLAYSGNTGAASVSAQVSDLATLTADDYLLSYDGANYALTNLTDDSTQTLGASGPFSVAGITINVSGTASAGDRFLIRPTRAAADGFTQLISDPRAVAAAAPIRASSATGNSGSATITPGEVLDASNASLTSSVSLVFADPDNYQVNGAGPLIAYTSGAAIDLNGWRVVISGAPAAGDSFTVQTNSGGAGDNRNALALAGLQDAAVLDNGTTSAADAYGQLVAGVGTQAHNASLAQTAQATLLEQSRAARSTVSGVNLDEEAANMVRLQQAYQAAAQVIAIGNSLFGTLLDMMRR